MNDYELCSKYGELYSENNVRMLSDLDKKLDVMVKESKEKIKQINEINDEVLNRYWNILPNESANGNIFEFGMLLEDYSVRPCVFQEKEPQKSTYVEFKPILKEEKGKTSLEKIFPLLKKKREAVILENNNAVEEAVIINKKRVENIEHEYKDAIAEYLIRKNKYEQQWNDEEEKKKNLIEEHNAQVLQWKTNYEKGEIDAIIELYNNILSEKNFLQDLLEKITVGYNKYTRKIVVESSVKDKDMIFNQVKLSIDHSADIKAQNGEVTEYTITTKTYEQKYSITEKNDLMIRLMIDLSIAIGIKLVKNDLEGYIESFVANMCHNDKCCISLFAEKGEFEEICFKNVSEKEKFISSNIKQAKQIARGIKPFESLYTEMD